jgi:lipopolysaccharide/colanic/teichoic acid biosynthesis glycosyltransferase
MSQQLPLWKRAFDILFSLLLIMLLWPVILGVAIWIKLVDGGPVFYAAERMRGPTEAFTLWKFRTMTPDLADSGVTGSDKANRITHTGKILRGKRLDELPQLWNILCGDISFVGPRPPLRRYVESYPEVYDDVLKSLPGVTGLATVKFHRHEEWILSQSTTAVETESLYVRRCIPRKAYLDRLYQKNLSFWLDVMIIKDTILPKVGHR